MQNPATSTAPRDLQLFQVLTTGPLHFVSALLLQNVVRDASAWDPKGPSPPAVGCVVWRVAPAAHLALRQAQQFPFPSHSSLQVISIFTFPSRSAGILYLSLRWSN